MRRAVPWKWIAIAGIITTSLLLLPACCCLKRLPPQTLEPPVTHIPPIGTEPIPTPTEAASKAPTQAQMHNVWFYIDPDTYLDIHDIRAEMVSKQPGTPLNFDNKLTFVMHVDTGKIGMRSASLDHLMNRYVFGYAGAPLRNLHITMDGKQLIQQGIIHKIVDIPFTMWADVSASNGKIRIHPTKVDICGINGLGLLKAVGQNLEKMLNLPHERGVSAEKNDLLLDPQKALPPPETTLTLVDVQIEGDELVQVFDAGKHLPPMKLMHPEQKNWMVFQHGTLRMGKLLMIDADMQVNDLDPGDPFSFFIDRYNDQLVAGSSHNEPDYGLNVFMRDWLKLGAK